MNLGTTKIGTPSPVQALTVIFAAPSKLGSISVTTQGISGLDFANAGTGTCKANTTYGAGQSCTVNVTFKPRFAGARYGAVAMQDASGNVIGTAYLQGTGTGPQVNFLPGAESTIASNDAASFYAMALDGSGNVYIADNATGVNVVWKETPSASGYTQSMVPTSSLNNPTGVAVDGAGNVYIADLGNNRVLKETPFAGGYTESVVADIANNSILSPITLAVDGNGAVYFFATSTLDYQGHLYLETPSAGGYIQSTVPYSGLGMPDGVAVDGSGNVLILDMGNVQVIKETPSASGYIQSIVPTPGLIQPYGIAVDGMGNIYITDCCEGPVLKETPTAGGYVQSTVSTSLLNEPLAIAADASGNVYIADTGNYRILKEDLADAPSLSFASTPIGSTSADSPQTVTVLNAGNAALTLMPPPPGAGPVISSGFVLNNGVPAACPVSSSASKTLAAGASCQLSVSFVPNAVRAFSGSLLLTDNNLYPANPPFAAQRIALSGTGTRITPTITWIASAPITYGTPLSTKQLNASSTVAGKFTYTPAAGKVLTAGQQTLTVLFTPNDSADYTTATTSVALTVNKATPAIAWPTPAAITYGTALSGTQLNAKASVPGALVYSPAAGTVPAVGTDTLTVTFTPTDTTDYTTATGSVMLKVNPAPSFTLGASPASLSVAQGASGKTTISVTGQNGFTGSVALAASGLPSGVTATFATNPTTGSSVLTLTASSTATAGTATVTIKGTSGSLTASTTIALTVSCTPTTITPYISINGGSTWTQESSATVNSPSTVVDLGPQPSSGGSWSWTGPNKYTSTSRQINSIPLTVGTDSYVATYTNPGGCKSTETFTITVK